MDIFPKIDQLEEFSFQFSYIHVVLLRSCLSHLRVDGLLFTKKNQQQKHQISVTQNNLYKSLVTPLKNIEYLFPIIIVSAEIFMKSIN